MPTRPAVPVVGFDLDLTLVDSAAGIAHTLRAALAGDPAGTSPSDEVLRPYVGIPLERTVRAVAPDADVAAVALRYRALYPALGVPRTTVLPGVVDAFGAIRARGGRVLVVSAKVESAVHDVLDHVGLGAPPHAPDLVVGGLFAADKGVRLRAEGAHVYVGDHPADMEAARVAGAVALGVETGSRTAADLRAAGAHAVLPDLRAFPAWFDAWSDAWSDGRLDGVTSTPAGARLDDEPGEGDREADRAEQGEGGRAAGG